MSLELLTSVGKRKHLIPDSLTHNAGTITAVFGTKVYTTVLSGLAANTRYQLYLIPNGTMVFSINENSVGPSGQTSWFLVGSFYATGNVTPVWGTFVNIEGSPNSRPWFGGLTQLSQSGGGFITKGGTIDIDEVIYTRMGAQIKIEWSHSKTGAGGSAPGGNWEYDTNTYFPTDNSLIPGITQEDTVNGLAQVTTAGDGRNLHTYYNNNNKWSFRYTTPSNTIASNTTHPYAAGSFRLGGNWIYPVQAFGVTPIKDL